MAKLSMKRQREILAERGIHNDHNLCAAVQMRRPDVTVVYIAYRAQDSSRAAISAAWQVIRPGFKTNSDPDAYYRDYGHRTFGVDGRKYRELKLQEAVAWASERYDWTELGWEKTPFGGYMPDEPLAEFLAEALVDPKEE